MTTKAQILNALDAEKFKHWLQEHPDAAMIANNTCECPIACYLKDTLQAKTVYVYGYMVMVSGIRADTSDWINEFTSLIDGESYHQPSISSQEALKALEEVLAE